MTSFEYEIPLWKNGHTVVGIDEVGRGCLAGPLTLGAVCMRPVHDTAARKEWLSLGIDDSKKLSEKRRKQLAEQIQKRTSHRYTVSVSVPTINSIGIMDSWRLAATKILSLCRLDFPHDTFTFLVDGPAVDKIPYSEEVHTISLVKGDAASITIAAASILAKVDRDGFMTRLANQFPHYHWEKNKGYGTQVHRRAIRQYGITPWHRSLFVRSIIQL